MIQGYKALPSVVSCNEEFPKTGLRLRPKDAFGIMRMFFVSRAKKTHPLKTNRLSFYGLLGENEQGELIVSSGSKVNPKSENSKFVFQKSLYH